MPRSRRLLPPRSYDENSVNGDEDDVHSPAGPWIRQRKRKEARDGHFVDVAVPGEDLDHSMAGVEDKSDGDVSMTEEGEDDDDGSCPSGGRLVPPLSSAYHAIPPLSLEMRAVHRPYGGPMRRWEQAAKLKRSMLCGYDRRRVEVSYTMAEMWQRYPCLPPRRRAGVMRSPWVRERDFETQQVSRAWRWYRGLLAREAWEEEAEDENQAGGVEKENGDGDEKGKNDHDEVADGVQRERALSAFRGRQMLPEGEGPLVVVCGPKEMQQEISLRRDGVGVLLSTDGTPLDTATDEKPAGCMFDADGIPSAMEWAPVDLGDRQLLAVATIPFEDQKHSRAKQGDGVGGWVDVAGALQFWEFSAEREHGKLSRPSKRLPMRRLVKCFDWGRPIRLQWCPVPLIVAGSWGMLALLCGDGKVRVINVKCMDDAPESTRYDWIDAPLATLSIDKEYGNKATSLAWLNTNRLVVGHSDGSLTLWSIYPRKLLQRIAVCATTILDMRTAYPSHPSVVAVSPIGGSAILVDIARPPSAEYSFSPQAPVRFQPNLLSWSEHLQGFIGPTPQASDHVTLAFSHVRFWAASHGFVFAGLSPLTCVNVGATHPFVLVGGADGSVWSFNLEHKVFQGRSRNDNAHIAKLEVFEAEYRPLPGQEACDDMNKRSAPRGVVRILQGFLPEVNEDAKGERRSMILTDKARVSKEMKKTKKGRCKGRARTAKEPDNDFVDDRQGNRGQGATRRMKELDEMLDYRNVIHEPLTRVTAVEWNPNVECSCWAACAMGCGLVRVLDLGVDVG